MELWTALLLGLGGSLHCVGMCGPLVLALSGGHQSRLRFIAGRLTYNAGRVATYALLGGLFGLFGHAVRLAGWQQTLSVALGLALLAAALAPYAWRRRLDPTTPVARLVAALKSALGKLFQRQTFPALFGIGLLNGLLPCGFVYLALAAALTQDGPLAGLSYMALFGTGTVPALLAVALAAPLIGPHARRWSLRLLPAALLLVGILLITRGLALDIPFISPVLAHAAPPCH